jgi:hypothetical protein
MRGVIIEPVSLNPGPGVGEGVGIDVGVSAEVELVLRESAGVPLAVDDPVAELPEQPTTARATSRPTRPSLIPGMQVAVRGRIDIF